MSKLSDYQAYRATLAQRLAFVSPDPRAPTDTLRSQMTLILAVADSQAGLGPAPSTVQQQAMATYPGGGFDQLVRDASQLSSAQWQSAIIPLELLRLATLVGSA